jgi:hypothetical protein
VGGVLQRLLARWYLAHRRHLSPGVGHAGGPYLRVPRLYLCALIVATSGQGCQASFRGNPHPIRHRRLTSAFRPNNPMLRRWRRAAERGISVPSMPRRKSLRSQLYRGARDLGNLEAAEKGPTSLGKRYVRRAAYRKTNTGLGGLLRAFGISGGRR